MDIPSIVELVKASGLTITVKQGVPLINGGKPGRALLEILKNHRDDVIKAAEQGLFQYEKPEWEICSGCQAEVKIACSRDVAFLCHMTSKICPYK